MPRFTVSLEKIAIETFSVVLGIGLAFGTNSWHERRVHAAAGCEALHAIVNEMAENDSALRARMPYHEAMRDSLAAVLARTHGHDVEGGLASIRNWHGIGSTQLLDDAWEAARSSQALQYLPYAVDISLSRVYARQQVLSDVNRGFYTVVYTPAFATGGAASIGAMQSYLVDLAAGERHLEMELARERRVTVSACE